MADTRIPARPAPANLSRTDKIDLFTYAAAGFVIAFLPNILCACGVL